VVGSTSELDGTSPSVLILFWSSSDADPALQSHRNRTEALMNLTRLRYFIAVAEAETVVGAAKALRVAQPALTRQLQALEKTVGAALFERHPRGVSLTAAGNALLAHAREAVRAADAGIAAARQASTSRVVNMSPPDWPHRASVVLRAVNHLRDQDPRIEIAFNIAPWTVSIDSLREGIIDVGFTITTSADVYDPDITAELLLPEPGLSAVLPGTHPLARQKSIRAMRDLKDLPSLVPPPERVGVLHAQMMAVIHGIAGPDAKTMDAPLNYSAASQLAAVGAGWILTPNSTGEITPPGTVVLPIEDAVMMLGFYVVRRTNDTRPWVLAFIDALREVCR
jgi:DNA-binding transcriptional LysR family regulator